MDSRTSRQHISIQKWKDIGYKGVLMACTGFGKTWVGCFSIKETRYTKQRPIKVLILCHTNFVAEKTWPEALEENNLRPEDRSVFSKLQISCIQGVYNVMNEDWDLIIADEIHNYLILDDRYIKNDYKYHRFFENNTFERFLGLSATVPTERRKSLASVGPIFDEITLRTAVYKQWIAPFRIVTLPTNFSEKESEDYLKAYRERERLLRRFDNDWDAAWKAIKKSRFLKNRGHKISAVDIDAVDLNRAIMRMNALVDGCEEKVSLPGEVLNSFNTARSIIFSKTTKAADKVCSKVNSCETYHAGKTKKQNTQVIERFSTGETRHISTVKALNEGARVPKVRMGFILNVGKQDLELIQRVGRVLKPGEDMSLTFMPYVKGTKDTSTLFKKLEMFDEEQIINAHTTDDLRDLVKQYAI